MPTVPVYDSMQVGATVEEVAAWLSWAEGRLVKVQEVRILEARALRKLRAEFRRRGLVQDDLEFR